MAIPMPTENTSAAGGGMRTGAPLHPRTRADRAPRKTASPALTAPPTLERVLDQIEHALADPAVVLDATTRTRWARAVRAESRSAGLLGRRSALSNALRELAEAVTRWDVSTSDAVVAALARVRAELATR